MSCSSTIRKGTKAGSAGTTTCAALDAVEEARACLTQPLSSLVRGAGGVDILKSLGIGVDQDKGLAVKAVDGSSTAAAPANTTNTGLAVLPLEDTPFGSRAMQMLPKIENEVLMGAWRGINRWFSTYYTPLINNQPTRKHATNYSI